MHFPLVMGDVEGSFDSTIDSNKESNNNTDKRESNFRGRNFSQKTTGKVSRQATSGRSMRSYNGQSNVSLAMTTPI